MGSLCISFQLPESSGIHQNYLEGSGNSSLLGPIAELLSQWVWNDAQGSIWLAYSQVVVMRLRTTALTVDWNVTMDSLIAPPERLLKQRFRSLAAEGMGIIMSNFASSQATLMSSILLSLVLLKSLILGSILPRWTMASKEFSAYA